MISTRLSVLGVVAAAAVDAREERPLPPEPALDRLPRAERRRILREQRKTAKRKAAPHKLLPIAFR